MTDVTTIDFIRELTEYSISQNPNNLEIKTLITWSPNQDKNMKIQPLMWELAEDVSVVFY